MTTECNRWVCLAWLLLISITGRAATPMVTASFSDSLFLNSDGSVWGAGSIANRWPGVTSPVRLLNFQNVVSIATASATDFALLADGTVQAVGWNGDGLLGNGTNSGSAASPVPVAGLSSVKAIAAGGHHVLVVEQDGTVWSWGKNDAGQLGDGTRNDRFSPARVAGLSNIVQVAASSRNSLALDASGIVWSWGLNYSGAAGDGTLGTNNTDDPNYFKMTPVRVRNLDQVVAIASGYGTNQALRADGTVWSWGDGHDGKNGDGQSSGFQTLPVPVSGLSNVVAIAVTNNHSLALKADGTVWAWGINNLGQLGTSAIAYSAVPVQVLGLSDIVAIAAGGFHSLVMRRDGAVYAWGLNGNAQLGDGTLISRPTPFPILGPGGSGQLNLIQPAPANPNQLPSALVTVSASGGPAPFTVTATATNANDPDGTVVGYLWSTSDAQQASEASATFTFSAPGIYRINLLVVDNQGGRGFSQRQIAVMPAAGGALQVQPQAALGGFRSLALSSGGHIAAWGQKDQLGILDPSLLQGLPQANPLPVAIGLAGVASIAASEFAAYALMAGGSVLSWGSNQHGELGVDFQTNFESGPTVVSGLPPIRALAASRHVLALTQQGEVFAWGDNSAGQLGVGDTTIRFQPVPVPGLADVVAVAAGWDFSLALKSDGTVWAWGNNTDNQLADGTTVSRYRPIQVPGLSGITKIISRRSPYWFAISANGSVWGVNVPYGQGFAGSTPAFGSRLRMPSLDGFVEFAGHGSYVLALKSDGTIWTWGQRFSGLLAIEGTGDITSPTQIPGITDVVGITVGNIGSGVWRRDGTVLTWGTNFYGQLGDGTFTTRESPVLVVNATFDGPLDLDPDVSNSIPPNLIPPFFLATYRSGDLSATSLAADVRGLASVRTLAAGGYNVYVAAAVPYSGSYLYFQLDFSNRWSSLTWPMADFLRGVGLGSQDALIRVNILQNVDLRAYIGASILVGYGTDPDEMVRNARYRTIFTVNPPQ